MIGLVITTPDPQFVHYQDHDERIEVAWLSANNRPAPAKVIAVGDELTADAAIKNAAHGTAMLWLGDFHNARQILSAMDRRLVRNPKKKQAQPTSDADRFYRLRQARAHRARVLSMILVPIEQDVTLALPRAPQIREAAWFGYGRDSVLGTARVVVSLQELIGMLGAFGWFQNGVPVPALGAKIHPFYGTFMPTRHEYVDLVAHAPLDRVARAFDIGTGTGVLAAVLARRGVREVIGTDISGSAIACATANFERLEIADIAHARKADMFPAGTADLIVCNPPWLPGSVTSSLDAAVYDPNSQMLLSFLGGLREHLNPGGQGWLILSDLAELLGLRTRDLLLDAIDQAGLEVLDRLDTVPSHKRATDFDDALHEARSREVTSLWILGVKP